MEQNAQTSKNVKCASYTQTGKWDIALETIAMHFYSNKKGTNEISILSNSDSYKTNYASYCQSVIWHNWGHSGSTFSYMSD